MASRDLSLWHDSLPAADTLSPRPALPGDRDTDVAIVGGGFTGLWTALYLRRLDPTLRVTIVEADVAGFGASGRNGGWCSALLPMSLESIAAAHGHDAAVALQREMFATVDEVGRAAAGEGIDCHFAKGGYVHLARNPAHTTRLRVELEGARRFGLGEADLRWLDRNEAAARVGAAGVLGALYTPHCAVIHPARLVRGLASAVEDHGAVIYETTRAKAIEQGRVVTEHGTLRADIVVRATEGYTRNLRGERRTLVPLYSLMIATEPLPEDAWETIGLRRARDLQRCPPPHHLWPAHRGWPAGVRRPGGAIPLRLGGAPRARPRRRYACQDPRDAACALPRDRRRGDQPPVGRTARGGPGLDLLRGPGP